TKFLNLLNADVSKPLIVDWSGIPVVSSSFADEVMGKLFVELGPIGFTARVRNVHMQNLIRQLVDKAIMERIAQTSREDAWAAWPILAAALLVPATALWFAQMIRVHGWPVAEYEDNVVLHARALAAIGGAGALAAIALTRKRMRQPAVGLIALPAAVLALTLG